ncbi:winged helix-turn-helix transcriptional regulator, partial [Candidatus Dojkabacteria bacterium]|nr:winged helix-turn-helix transcriptional regulator [Candidatus Dojkabacteria bacterium]
THLLNDGEDNTPEITIMTKFVRSYSKVDQKYDLISPSYNSAQSDSLFIEGNGVDISDGNVYVNGRQIEQDLSQRELHILKYFIRNANKVISREEIAQLIWGKLSADKYSDWAIDQSISRLRKKLGDNAYESAFIKTVKGRGFRYEV